MSLSTSNSDVPASDGHWAGVKLFVRWALGRAGIGCATLVVLLVAGELYMRAMFLPSIIYRRDAELGYTYRPNHRAITWQGNYSMPSPPLSFNSDGNRGEDSDWSKKIVLSLGSSEVVGPGIADDETWAAQLETLIHEADGSDAVEVVNGAYEGHGPFQHAVVFDRFLDKHDIDTAVMRVSVGDRHFKRPKDIPEKSWLHHFLRDNTIFVRFLINKSLAQIRPAKKATVPFPFRRDKKKTDPHFMDFAKKMWEANESHWKQAVDSAVRENVRLVFLVINATGKEGETYLANQLRGLIGDAKNVSVLELGPDVFGLDTLPFDEREPVFVKDLTLGFDPHGNATQHRTVAESLQRYLTENPRK